MTDGVGIKEMKELLEAMKTSAAAQDLLVQALTSTSAAQQKLIKTLQKNISESEGGDVCADIDIFEPETKTPSDIIGVLAHLTTQIQSCNDEIIKLAESLAEVIDVFKLNNMAEANG